MPAERIVRSILMSAAVVLGLASCNPEPLGDNDAGAGGGGGQTGFTGFVTRQ